MKLFQQIIQLMTCVLFLAAIAINKEHKSFGYSFSKNKSIETKVADKWETENGFLVISTANIAKEIWGFGGNIPLHIYLKDGKVVKVDALKKSESPDFFNSVLKSGLLEQWDGLSPHEAVNKKVDAVSGATMSSTAIIQSMKKAMEYLDTNSIDYSQTPIQVDFRLVCVIIVILCGTIIPFFGKNRIVRTIQLCMNVIVLGFWSGSFLSLSLFVNFLSNGINVWHSIIPITLLIVAFIMPLFGKKSHYCTWICPMGSCQEIVGKIVPYKIKMKANTIQTLDNFREHLWVIIMLVMWLGVGFELLDYELFSAFIFKQISIPLLIVFGIFIILSSIIQRPYCRFICPTGSILKYCQSTK